MRFPDPRHRHVTHLELHGQRARAPVGRICGRAVQRGFDNAFEQFVLGPARTATMRGILGNPRATLGHKTFLP